MDYCCTVSHLGLCCPSSALANFGRSVGLVGSLGSLGGVASEPVGQLEFLACELFLRFQGIGTPDCPYR